LHFLIGLSDLSRDIPDCRQVCHIVIHADRILRPEAPSTCTIDDAVVLIDAAAPTPKPRCPYRIRVLR
jgi:hypothetical protein